MNTALTRWRIRRRQRPMADQLALSRSLRREARYLLSDSLNARRLREAVAELNSGASHIHGRY